MGVTDILDTTVRLPSAPDEGQGNTVLLGQKSIALQDTDVHKQKLMRYVLLDTTLKVDGSTVISVQQAHTVQAASNILAVVELIHSKANRHALLVVQDTSVQVQVKDNRDVLQESIK